MDLHFPDNKFDQSIFSEHIITQGSAKYSEFSDFCSNTGVYYKATTYFDRTLYYFDIPQAHLDEGLDRFMTLLKSPLMPDQGIVEESEAINAEFLKNQNNDINRRYQLLAALAKENSPINIFSWGNSKTLKDNIDIVTLRAKAIDYYQKNYSAHRMCAVIHASMSLDDLQNLAVKHLSGVVNNGIPGPDYTTLTCEDIFQPKFFEKVYFVEPVQGTSQIDIHWCLPPQIGNYKKNPFGYLTNVISWDGSGGLFSYLRNKLWANCLKSRLDTPFLSTNTLFTLFHISITLTDVGLVHLDEVIDAIFAYLRSLKQVEESGRLYKEMAKVKEISFNYSPIPDQVSYFQDLTQKLALYPEEDILGADTLYYEYDAELIKGGIDHLNSSKFNIMITTRNSQAFDNTIVYNQEEKWFGTKYAECEMPDKWKRSWESTTVYPEFFLPEPNDYLSADFTIFYDKTQSVGPFPVKLVDDKFGELWFRLDDKFLLPRAIINFNFVNPLINFTAKRYLFIAFINIQ